MGDVVSLNRFRKQHGRAAKARRSVENRARAGRGKAERRAMREEAARADATLEGKRIERAPDAPQERGERTPRQ